MTPLTPIRTTARRPLARRFPEFDNRLRRLFEGTFGELEDIGWSPAVEVSETDEALELTAELPGMKAEDVEIELENDVLTLRGLKKAESEKEEKKGKVTYRVTERSYGEFCRSFTLPSNVNADDISAVFESGVLHVHLPKTAEARGRKIEVKG